MTQAPRRNWLIGAAALAAAAGGAAWQWRRRDSASELEGQGADFFASRFNTPTGGTLAMDTLRGQPLVVNFWATWCPPCVNELPELDAFHLAHRDTGWQTLGVAVDQSDAVQRFLARAPVHFPIVVAGYEGAEWARRLGNTVGGLPYTVLFDARANVLRRKIGPTTAHELSIWASAAI